MADDYDPDETIDPDGTIREPEDSNIVLAEFRFRQERTHRPAEIMGLSIRILLFGEGHDWHSHPVGLMDKVSQGKSPTEAVLSTIGNVLGVGENRRIGEEFLDEMEDVYTRDEDGVRPWDSFSRLSNRFMDALSRAVGALGREAREEVENVLSRLAELSEEEAGGGTGPSGSGSGRERSARDRALSMVRSVRRDVEAQGPGAGN